MTKRTPHIHNGRLAAQIQDAGVCLADLARSGAEVLSIDIGQLSVPRIRIARPVSGVKGGLMTIFGGNGRRTETYAARHKHCQVEWRVEA